MTLLPCCMLGLGCRFSTSFLKSCLIAYESPLLKQSHITCQSFVINTKILNCIFVLKLDEAEIIHGQQV